MSVVQQVPTSLRRSAASLQSVVGVATELRAGRSGDRMPVEARNFVSSPERSDRLWGSRSVLFSGLRFLSLGKAAAV